MMTAFSAMRRRYCAVAPVVRPENSGISEMGSTTTKKTTRNFSGCSNMVLCAKSYQPAAMP